MGASPSALQPSWLHARRTVAADSARGDLAPSSHVADDAWALVLENQQDLRLICTTRAAYERTYIY
jgi:hypothetical protein